MNIFLPINMNEDRITSHKHKI